MCTPRGFGTLPNSIPASLFLQTRCLPIRKTVIWCWPKCLCSCQGSKGIGLQAWGVHRKALLRWFTSVNSIVHCSESGNWFGNLHDHLLLGLEIKWQILGIGILGLLLRWNSKRLCWVIFNVEEFLDHFTIGLDKEHLCSTNTGPMPFQKANVLGAWAFLSSDTVSWIENAAPINRILYHQSRTFPWDFPLLASVCIHGCLHSLL